MKRKIAAGNWKMNGTNASLAELQILSAAHPSPKVDILICPPATLIVQAAGLFADSPLMIGAQDCHPLPDGPHTGDVSAPMLADAGAKAVILGHSERRDNHGETNALVRQKALAGHAAGLIALICIGESQEERSSGRAIEVITNQLDESLPVESTGDNTIIAYEPVWAIGTGLTPTPEQIGEAHDCLRAALTRRYGVLVASEIRLIYGGSVRAENAAGIFATPNVDGALVGGASLRAEEFSAIINALEASL